jgi:hypothetical protein
MRWPYVGVEPSPFVSQGEQGKRVAEVILIVSSYFLIPK